jgi:hypothetical protein
MWNSLCTRLGSILHFRRFDFCCCFDNRRRNKNRLFASEGGPIITSNPSLGFMNLKSLDIEG